MNYFTNYDLKTLIEGCCTKRFSFITRFCKGYSPKNQPFDAQWFFDSIIASINYSISLKSSDQKERRFYLKQGDVHLKRALGQLTGPNAMSASGEKVQALSLPESINTVNIAEYNFKAVPSPICPLSWATAAMKIALSNGTKAHANYEALTDCKITRKEIKPQRQSTF
jgi:hypothetical protein